jgi:glycosyltransferase involved in cell wall biosynthesis
MSNSDKKTILIATDNSIAMTGFGKVGKQILTYLYKTNKYNLIHFAVGSVQNPDLDRFPWKTIGAVNPQKLNNIKQQNKVEEHGNIERMAGYGSFDFDEAVYKYKPDIVIKIQDWWGINYSISKPWFDKVTSVLWTTLDSLPLLPDAVDNAPKVKNYWIWADFATKEMHRLGHKQVKTVRGPLETKDFYKLPNEIKMDLRLKNGIATDAFVIGFVFRNQLRKSVPNLLEGFKAFKKDCSKAKLLLHTHWGEGWDIPRLIKENQIDNNDVLTTYICKNCRKYEIKSFIGHDLNCKHCKAEKSQITTGPGFGVSDAHLNEIYNLMSVYVHPFTSGGQEIPIQEAKLAELITLVTNYSCGEDSCEPEAYSLPLDWVEYREPGTQFIKATTLPFSIVKQLNKVYKMSEQERKEMGKKAKKWVIENFSIEKIGYFLEKFIDNCEKTSYDFIEKEESKDPYANIPAIEDNNEWIISLYKNILKTTMTSVHPDHIHWKQKLEQGMSRQDIENYFKKVAWEDNQKKQLSNIKFEDLLDKKDKKRVILVQPESAGDILLITSLFKSIRERYPRPDWGFYVSTKPEYRELLEGNEFIDRWLEYNPNFDNHIWLTGNKDHEGFFTVALQPYFGTQKLLDYLSNGEDKLDLDLKK